MCMMGVCSGVVCACALWVCARAFVRAYMHACMYGQTNPHPCIHCTYLRITLNDDLSCEFTEFHGMVEIWRIQVVTYFFTQ